MKLSIAIPYHGNRSEWTLRTIKNCHNIAQVGEIVLSVEPDTSAEELRKRLINYKKVKVFSNAKQLFVFRNKITAVQRCAYEWVALIDSDNIINCQYIDAFTRQKNFNQDIIYAPSMGFPSLDYSRFIGEDINKRRVGEIMMLKDDYARKFDMLMNTMNYIVNKARWLHALSDAINSDYEPRTADSSWINFNCWQTGMIMRVIKGMVYTHTMHPLDAPKDVQSTYRLYSEEGVAENTKIKDKMKEWAHENSNNTENLHAGSEKQVSPAPNWAATGGQGSTLVSEKQASDPKNLLTD